MFVFEEKISEMKLLSFCLVWAAIIIYIGNSLRVLGMKKLQKENSKS